MGHVPVPWFIGGDAITPDKIARLVSYISAGGREGVLNALDCRVLALSTPGPAIRVLPGAYTINNRTAVNENYSGMVESEDVVSTTATGSGGGRSDLVVVIVKDSNNPAEGWDIPADPANGPYIQTEIITGVPSTTTTWSQLGLLGSAIALARIDFPPSTATVTQAMIKDLRSSAAAAGNAGGTSGGGTGGTGGTVTPDPVACAPTPQSATFVDVKNCTANSVLNPPTSGSTASAWSVWPTEAQWSVPFPSWATEMAFYASINPGLGGNTWGELRFNINSGSLISTAVGFDVNFPQQSFGGANLTFTNGGGMRGLYVVGGRLAIPASLRGKTVSVKIEGRTFDDPVGGYRARGGSSADRGAVLNVNIAFKQGASLS